MAYGFFSLKASKKKSATNANFLSFGHRHADYLRYRRYCSQKLMRLRLVLKFTHGYYCMFHLFLTLCCRSKAVSEKDYEA